MPQRQLLEALICPFAVIPSKREMWKVAESSLAAIDPLAAKLETLPPGTSSPVAVNAPFVVSCQFTLPKNVDVPENERPEGPTVPVKVCGGGALPPNTDRKSTRLRTTGEPVAPVPPIVMATVIGPLEPNVVSFQVPA